MKKLLFFLGLLTCTSLQAEPLKQVFNTFTNKPDYITRVDTNTIIPGTGVTITCTNGACTVNSTGGGGGGAGALETIFGAVESSPTATLRGRTGDFLGIGTGSTMTIVLDPATTNYIHNQNTLQTGTTFYTSSGTVKNQFNLAYTSNTAENGGFRSYPILVASNTMVQYVPNFRYFYGNGETFAISGSPDLTIFDDLLDIDGTTTAGADTYGASIRMTCTGSVTSCNPTGGAFYATTDKTTQVGKGVSGKCFGNGTCYSLYSEGGTGTGLNYGLYTKALFSTGGNYAGYFKAQNGASNYGIFVDDGQVLINSSMTVLGGQGATVKYGIAVGSITGSGLSTCGDGTHAVNYSGTTGLFGCQAITGSSGIVSAGTFTWVNNFGLQVSTLAIINSSVINSLTVSTSATGINLVAISSAIAVNPNDYILTLASPTIAAPILFGVQLNGHVVSSGTTPSVSACGTSPTIDPNSTDVAGKINVGSVTATACTLTFASAYLNAPICTISDDSTVITPGITSLSNTTLTVGFSASLAGGHVWYSCIGSKG